MRTICTPIISREATLSIYTAKEAKHRAGRQPATGSAHTVFGRHFSSALKSVTMTGTTATQQPINRFTPEAVQQDIATDLQLIGTDFLDLVYLDDRPHLPFEPVIEAIGSEIASGRVRSFGVRNFTAERLRAAHAFACEDHRAGHCRRRHYGIEPVCFQPPLMARVCPLRYDTQASGC